MTETTNAAVAVSRRKLAEGSVPVGLIRQGMKWENVKGYLRFEEEHAVQLHSGPGVGMARVSQFAIGQTGICGYVPILINRDDVI